MRRVLLLKPCVFIACLVPALWLLWGAWQNQLGANPAETIIRASGDWTLRLLCCTLAITPLREQFNWTRLAPLRRILGLFAYFYALLHLLSYAWFDQGLVLSDMAQDILQRPFIAVGFVAVLLLTPLALTSFNAAIRKLGARRWQQLHRLVYAVAVLAMVHFFWMRAGKNDFAEVLLYAAVLSLLLGWRLYRRWNLHRRWH
jgi:sulfoxide reductase heme-binding subunit YedZ